MSPDSRLEAALCVGAVMHERLAPVVNRFVYPLFFLRLPLSRLQTFDSVWLGIDRPRPIALRFRDHGARDGSHPLPWIRALLAREGIPAEGEVVLQTLPRVFGYAFKPVSFWFCHDRDGALRAVLCEVNNTFGERHDYLVAHADARPIGSGDTLRARKVFHVSPFFPVEGEYLFRFRRHGPAHALSIDYLEGGRELLRTRLWGRAEALTPSALARALGRFPLLGLGVIGRIHWQALRLWAKRVPFFRKPLPPLQQTTR